MDDENVLAQLLGLLQEYRRTQREGKFLEYHPPDELRQLLELDRTGGKEDWQEIFHWVEKYLRYSPKTHHRSFVNRMWTGANLSSIVGEMVTAVTNSSACTFESAPVSTLMEEYMVGEMLSLAGFVNGTGQMTTGSSNANMVAMMVARNCANPSVKKCGLCGQQKLFAFVSEDSHYSMDKAANILGLGVDQLLKVPVDEYASMKVDELELMLERVVASGGIPFFVTATAGTTVRGGYDSIDALLKLRKRYNFWLHVDGAWGGAALFSDTLRGRYLHGLEQSDSFTCDFHKMLGSSLMCNILLLNGRPDGLRYALSAGDGSYLFREELQPEFEDPGLSSLQCGRRVDSLKWFLDWKFFGKEGFGQRIERYMELCCYAEELVKNSDELELVVPRTSFNICFRYRLAGSTSEDLNHFNLALRNRLYTQGACLVGLAYVQGELTMRLLLTNPAVSRDDVDLFFADVLQVGRALLAERVEHV